MKALCQAIGLMLFVVGCGERITAPPSPGDSPSEKVVVSSNRSSYTVGDTVVIIVANTTRDTLELVQYPEPAFRLERNEQGFWRTRYRFLYIGAPRLIHPGRLITWEVGVPPYFEYWGEYRAVVRAYAGPRYRRVVREFVSNRFTITQSL